MDEVAQLNRLGARAVIASMGGSPGFELGLSPNCGLALSGEPLADLNMLFLGPDVDVLAFFARAMARVAERDLPLLALMTPHVTSMLGPVAERLGLTAAGTAPLMVLRAGPALNPGRACDIRRVLDPDDVRVAGDLASAAFSLDRAAMARAMDVGVTPTSGAETWVAYDGGAPMSAVTVTPTGPTAGIWTMATPPEKQGRGMGRALLTKVIERYRAEGVERFYLVATVAGRPLYESLGCEAIADYSLRVLGHSTQTST